MIIAATGHRPEKLGGYSHTAYSRLMTFAIRQLVALRPDKVIIGMAQGWDTAVAEASKVLGIPFMAAIPFEGQEFRWPALAQANYRRLLDVACDVHYVSTIADSSSWAQKFQARNEWMVQYLEPLGGDTVLALWNGSPGGTANTVRYAVDNRRPVVNTFADWQEYEFS